LNGPVPGPYAAGLAEAFGPSIAIRLVEDMIASTWTGVNDAQRIYAGKQARQAAPAELPAHSHTRRVRRLPQAQREAVEFYAARLVANPAVAEELAGEKIYRGGKPGEIFSKIEDLIVKTPGALKTAQDLYGYYIFVVKHNDSLGETKVPHHHGHEMQSLLPEQGREIEKRAESLRISVGDNLRDMSEAAQAARLNPEGFIESVEASLARKLKADSQLRGR
jgi:hypothetical protein